MPQETLGDYFVIDERIRSHFREDSETFRTPTVMEAATCISESSPFLYSSNVQSCEKGTTLISDIV